MARMQEIRCFLAQKVVTMFSAFRLNPAFFALTDAHLHRVVRASDPCEWFRRKFNASQRRAFMSFMCPIRGSVQSTISAVMQTTKESTHREQTKKNTGTCGAEESDTSGGVR